MPTTRYILSQYIETVEVSNEEVTAPIAHGNPSDKTECSYLETVAVKHSDLFIRYSEIIKDDRICEIIDRLSTNEQENSKKIHRNIENPTNSLDKSYNSNYPTDFVWDNFCISDITVNKKSHPCKCKGGRSGGAEENRTPVRKQIRRPFYTLSKSFEISLTALRFTGLPVR